MNTTITAESETGTIKRHDKKNDVRIAIVEDDPMYRSAIEYYLKKIPGNRLFSFGSGEECLRYYHLLDPEIMILDYRLNDVFESGKMNGLDIMHKVKSVKPETEIIFLSGQENLDIATEAIKGGASEYIFKDFNALAKLQGVVTHMSLYVRMKRQEMNQTKWILAFLSAIVLVLAVTYWTGHFNLSSETRILYVSTAIALIAFFAIVRKRKKEKAETIPEQHDVPPPLDERPGLWHD